MKVLVNVSLRKSVLDPQGQAINEAIKRAGYDFVKDVRQNKVFEIVAEGRYDEIKGKIEEIAKNMLSNPIIENYEIEYIKEQK